MLIGVAVEGSGGHGDLPNQVGPEQMAAVKQTKRRQDGYWKEGLSVPSGWREQILWVCKQDPAGGE